MKTTTQTITVTTYHSEVMPDVRTDSEHFRDVIVWGDANPVAWKIVTAPTTKTLFGVDGIVYMGCQRGRSPRLALERLATFKQEVDGRFLDNKPAETSIFQWRARFALEHFGEAGYRRGFFQQWDGQYDRGCTELDYTPDSLDEAVRRFKAWCESGSSACFVTRAIKVDGKVVREYPPPKKR